MVRDLRVMGFGGHEISMWCQTTGDAYSDCASYVRRTDLDSTLFNEAVRAGALPIHGRIGNPIRHDTGRLIGVSLDSGRALGAEFFIGADGSTTRLGQIANLVDPARGLWCFAIRTYLPSSLDSPYIILWDEKPWKAFPGYGWIFPDGRGWANVGVGIGVGANRSEGARATRELDGFIDRMAHRGFIETAGRDDLRQQRLGGWLRMGLSGTKVAAGNVLLAGDAAALVNPYQGEGISQAIESGRAAAQAILKVPAKAAQEYTSNIWDLFGRHEAPAAAIQTKTLRHLRIASAAGHILTRWPLAAVIGESSANYLGQLTDGAIPGRSLRTAKMIESFSNMITSRSNMRRDIEASFGGPFAKEPTGQARRLADLLAA
jgi:flavin-dependent dehydrogenase